MKTGGSLEENLRFFVISPFPGGLPSPPCNLHAPDSARGRRPSLRKKTATDEAAPVILPDLDPETALRAARQDGPEAFHADVTAGEQILQHKEDALPRTLAVGRSIGEPRSDLRAQTPRITDLVHPPRFDDVGEEIRRPPYRAYCRSRSQPHSSNCRRISCSTSPRTHSAAQGR